MALLLLEAAGPAVARSDRVGGTPEARLWSVDRCG